MHSSMNLTTSFLGTTFWSRSWLPTDVILVPVRARELLIKSIEKRLNVALRTTVNIFLWIFLSLARTHDLALSLGSPYRGRVAHSLYQIEHNPARMCTRYSISRSICVRHVIAYRSRDYLQIPLRKFNFNDNESTNIQHWLQMTERRFLLLVWCSCGKIIFSLASLRFRVFSSFSAPFKLSARLQQRSHVRGATFAMITCQRLQTRANRCSPLAVIPFLAQTELHEGGCERHQRSLSERNYKEEDVWILTLTYNVKQRVCAVFVHIVVVDISVAYSSIDEAVRPPVGGIFERRYRC